MGSNDERMDQETETLFSHMDQPPFVQSRHQPLRIKNLLDVLEKKYQLRPNIIHTRSWGEK